MDSQYREQLDGLCEELRSPRGWKHVPLSEICDEIYRYPSFYGMEHCTGGIPVIRGEHIDSSGEISRDWNQSWCVSKAVSDNFPRTVLRTGDLVFTVRGTIGKVGIVREAHEGALNRMEALIRAFDPCLSCATHAIGRSGIVYQLLGPDGTLLDEAR